MRCVVSCICNARVEVVTQRAHVLNNVNIKVQCVVGMTNMRAHISTRSHCKGSVWAWNIVQGPLGLSANDDVWTAVPGTGTRGACWPAEHAARAGHGPCVDADSVQRRYMYRICCVDVPGNRHV